MKKAKEEKIHPVRKIKRVESKNISGDGGKEKNTQKTKLSNGVKKENSKIENANEILVEKKNIKPPVHPVKSPQGGVAEGEFNGASDDSAASENAENPAVKISEIAAMAACVYCLSKNIVKRGKRQNKLEEVQLYLCQDCGRTFTGKKIKGKKYPTRMILDGVSYYNVGFSLEESAKFLERSYGTKVDASTISHWVKELADICSYGRLRDFGLKIYSPAQVVQSFQMYHRQIYRFRYHRAKIALALQEFGHWRFSPLREYLDSIATDCPHYLFKESDRSSEIKAEMDLHEVRISEKQNRATQLAQLVLQSVADNKWRHDALQKFMLANDSVTVATEVPVFFEREDYDWMKDNLKFDIPFEMERTITGHIDFVQIRNKSVHILDYKPDASRAQPVAQLVFYALALSRLTGLRLFDFKCAWFDEKNYYEFFPLHVVYKKKKRGRGRGKEEAKKQITHTDKIIEN